MDDRVRITIEVDAADHDALHAIAHDRACSLDEIAIEALHTRIDLERDYIEGVKEGLADIAAGRILSDEEYLAHAAERRRRWIAERQR